MLSTPKDVYVMPIITMLVDSIANNELLSFMDPFFGYNQILIVVDDISKIAFRFPGSLGTFEWLVMPFGLKNASPTLWGPFPGPTRLGGSEPSSGCH